MILIVTVWMLSASNDSWFSENDYFTLTDSSMNSLSIKWFLIPVSWASWFSDSLNCDSVINVWRHYELNDSLCIIYSSMLVLSIKWIRIAEYKSRNSRNVLNTELNHDSWLRSIEQDALGVEKFVEHRWWQYEASREHWLSRDCDSITIPKYSDSKVIIVTVINVSKSFK